MQRRTKEVLVVALSIVIAMMSLSIVYDRPSVRTQAAAFSWRDTPRYVRGAQALFSSAALPARTQTQTIRFGSDPTWAVTDAEGQPRGMAQSVCLNNRAPANCPPGALAYGYPGAGWGVNLSSIPGAQWIWAAGLTGATAPAYPAEFIFSKTFLLTGTPTAGSLSVVADDFAEIRVNGALVGVVGSPTDAARAAAASAALTAFNLVPFLRQGANEITVRAANGIFGCGRGEYRCNPAGVVFGGVLEWQPPRPATGPPAIRGFADTHNHQFAYLGFGGKAFVGAAYGPIEQALKWCDYGPGHGLFTPNLVHGPGGARDLLGNPLRVIAYGISLPGIAGHKVGGYPQFDGWPRWDSVTHQTVYEDWLLRALQGGLKLMVMLAVNNEPMCGKVEKAPGRTCNDMEAVDLQIAEAKRMEAYLDAKHGGPGRGWYRIVRSPREAREVINQGKLAVVLGIEVDYLLNCQQEGANCTPAYVSARLKDYYNLGVRHIFPIHFANNAFGGASYDKPLQYDARQPINGPHQSYPLNLRDCGAEGYQRDGGRCNALGLTETGKHLIRACISQGMIVDIDHMSAMAFNDTLSIAESRNWPVISGHSGYVEISKGDRANEGNLKAAQIARIRGLGGMISAIVRQGTLAETQNWRGASQPLIDPTCGASSQSLAQAYLYASDKMQGGPVALGSDFNGYAGLPGPRFGPDACPGGKAGGVGVGVISPTNAVSYPFRAIATDAWLGRSVVGQKTFDFNTDGLAHVGLLPDLIADLEKMGLTESHLASLLSSAEGYIRMWEKIESKKDPPAPPGPHPPQPTCQEQCGDLKASCLAGDGGRPGNQGRCNAAYRTCLAGCR